MKIIWDGEPRTATSTFTQPLSSVVKTLRLLFFESASGESEKEW